MHFKNIFWLCTVPEKTGNGQNLKFLKDLIFNLIQQELEITEASGQKNYQHNKKKRKSD